MVSENLRSPYTYFADLRRVFSEVNDLASSALPRSHVGNGLRRRSMPLHHLRSPALEALGEGNGRQRFNRTTPHCSKFRLLSLHSVAHSVDSAISVGDLCGEASHAYARSRRSRNGARETRAVRK